MDYLFHDKDESGLGDYTTYQITIKTVALYSFTFRIYILLFNFEYDPNQTQMISNAFDKSRYLIFFHLNKDSKRFPLCTLCTIDLFLTW